MTRTLLAGLCMTVIVTAQTQTLVDSSTPLTRYNHKFALRSKHQQLLASQVKIDKEEARKLAEKYCGEKVRSQYLTHKGQLLFYRSHTAGCSVDINALDGNKIRLKRETVKETTR